MTHAIQFYSTGKKYRLGQIGTGTFSRDLSRRWARFRRRPDPFEIIPLVEDKSRSPKTNADQFVWALKDLDLTIEPGQVVGIIGNNGAGKSTLLKLLAKITRPTVGEIGINGRVSSLLEVGTGFHPELTGRENVFLNGSILGMRSREIQELLDDIVDFSGCGAFIDTPVKRYSSGMRMRLGFAVAAFLTAENLIIDEVLAVGDVGFQKQCLGRIKEITSEGGRTVLLVSHNLGVINSIASDCIWLHDGSLVDRGQPTAVVGRYLQQRSTLNQEGVPGRFNGKSDGWLSSIVVVSSGAPTSTIRMGDELAFEFELHRRSDKVASVMIGLAIENELGSRILTVGSIQDEFSVDFSSAQSESDVIRATCNLGTVPLNQGKLRDYRDDCRLQFGSPRTASHNRSSQCCCE